MVQTHTHTNTQFFLNAPFSSVLGRSADTAFISGFSGALNWSHKQTAGVGVYDNINEKLLWGPAGWWSRVKLPGLLHSIIVYLISASLLFGSTPGSPPPSSSHGRLCNSRTEWNKKVQTSRTVCCEWMLGKFFPHLHHASHRFHFLNFEMFLLLLDWLSLKAFILHALRPTF